MYMLMMIKLIISIKISKIIMKLLIDLTMLVTLGQLNIMRNIKEKPYLNLTQELDAEDHLEMLLYKENLKLDLLNQDILENMKLMM